MPAEANSLGGSSVSELAYCVGGLVAAVVAGWLGYSRKPKPATATVLGALVDNSAVRAIADALAENTAELRALRAVIARDAAESRMRELLELLEQKVAERRA